MLPKTTIVYIFWTNVDTFVNITSDNHILSILKKNNWNNSIIFFPENDAYPVCITFYGPIYTKSIAEKIINHTLIKYPEMIPQN